MCAQILLKNYMPKKYGIDKVYNSICNFASHVPIIQDHSAQQYHKPDSSSCMISRNSVTNPKFRKIITEIIQRGKQF